MPIPSPFTAATRAEIDEVLALFPLCHACGFAIQPTDTVRVVSGGQRTPRCEHVTLLDGMHFGDGQHQWGRRCTGELVLVPVLVPPASGGAAA